MSYPQNELNKGTGYDRNKTLQQKRLACGTMYFLSFTSSIMLQSIRIILVGTTDQRNIGSAARAMKTMGLSQLYLVHPKETPGSAATALASGASDVLAQAVQTETLEEALQGCQLVIGTSSRSRTLDWPHLTPRQAAHQAMNELEAIPQEQVAVVFGREATGLTNDELQLCHYHVEIPTNPDYASLNLAMAVQLIAYEMRIASLDKKAEKQELVQPQALHQETSEVYPSHEQMEGFYHHLERSIQTSGFLKLQHPGKVMQKLRRLYTKARPNANELNILRGILSSYDKKSR